MKTQRRNWEPTTAFVKEKLSFLVEGKVRRSDHFGPNVGTASAHCVFTSTNWTRSPTARLPLGLVNVISWVGDGLTAVGLVVTSMTFSAKEE